MLAAVPTAFITSIALVLVGCISPNGDSESVDPGRDSAEVDLATDGGQATGGGADLAGAPMVPPTTGGSSDAPGGSDAAAAAPDASPADAPVRPDTGPEASPPALPPGVQGHPDPSLSYARYPGFTLALAEEFKAPLNLDHDPIWTWSDGGFSEGKVRFVKDAISFANGRMIITAGPPGVPGSASFAEPASDGDSGFVATKELRSGEVRTRFNNYRYGRYEVRARPPISSGNFISTFSVFRTPRFEQWREIAIELTAARRDGAVTNLIVADGVSTWNPTIEELVSTFPSGPGAMPVPASFSHQGYFHTYAFEWLPDRVTWFIDDVPIRVKSSGGTLPIPERSAKIVMDLWVFAVASGFSGDPAGNTYPLTSEYEWIRFYKWDHDAQYPCAAPPGCLLGDDRNKSKNNPDDGLPP